MNQELIVAHEIFMTPTAMLADYVMPGDVFTERNHVADELELGDPPDPQPEGRGRAAGSLEHLPLLDRSRAPHGPRRALPVGTLEDILDHRLARGGRTFAEFQAETFMEIQPPEFRKYRSTGFATPSGKVELASSILRDLGFDPVPYHREAPGAGPEHPYLVFTGVREDPFFQTGQRNIDVLRARCPNPKLFMHPDDAAREGIEDGDWARLSTATGEVTAEVSVQPSMKPGHIRVPHGWWYPEMRGEQEWPVRSSSRTPSCATTAMSGWTTSRAYRTLGFPAKVAKAERPAAFDDADPESWEGREDPAGPDRNRCVTKRTEMQYRGRN